MIKAWFVILAGRVPSLSIEITKECPLRCPGCYAFDSAHLGTGLQLRNLSDYKGNELVTRVVSLLEEHKPLHVSLVGGDPLVRHRELELLLPAIEGLGIHTQIVTSAFRAIPRGWARFNKLNVVVSVDGLAPEHDARRKPATYERILRNISGSKVNIHCTITSQIACRPGYLEAFLHFWSGRPEVVKVWFSMFTPQRGASDPEILTPSQRSIVIDELMRLQKLFPVLDMPPSVLREFATPPRIPSACIFARTTKTVSADLLTEVSPCQLDGVPDCENCGCYASVGLAAVGHHRVLGPITAGRIFEASYRIGTWWKSLKRSLRRMPPVQAPRPLLKVQ